MHVRIEGLPPCRMKCASKQVVGVVISFELLFICTFVLKWGHKKGELVEHSTVFSVFSQKDF